MAPLASYTPTYTFFAKPARGPTLKLTPLDVIRGDALGARATLTDCARGWEVTLFSQQGDVSLQEVVGVVGPRRRARVILAVLG